MYYHAQNLNERNNQVVGSMLWHGRAWLNFGKPYKGRQWNWEWCFGKHARSFHIGCYFGHGDGNDGIMLMFGIPWMISLYVGVDGVMRLKKECEFGISIHNNSFWFKVLAYSWESNHDDPWWRRTHCIHFPWQLDWFKTEILSHDRNAVWCEVAGHKAKFLDGYEIRKAAEKSVSKVYDYVYALKNGTVQKAKATVHVSRMTHRARWWPIIPIERVSMSIWADFSSELGEGTGSWKGGVTGCGYTLRPDETPEQCLRRMEAERKFDR